MKGHKTVASYRATYGLIEDFLKLMDERGITKAELARRLKVTKPVVSRFFIPGHSMTLHTAVAIAHALEADLKLVLIERGFENTVTRKDIPGEGTS